MTAPDIEIRDLAHIPSNEIENAFIDAFADYATSFGREQIRDMLTRRGASKELSFGAFVDGKIVSFILNGVGDYNKVPTAYDTGTGTIKSFRGRGLTDELFRHASEALRRAGIKRYVLEVLQDNAPAVKIYSRLGFKATRDFDCFTGDNDSILEKLARRATPDIVIKQVSFDDIVPLLGFMDFQPSWQNSPESIRRHPGAFLYIIAQSHGKPVGFGVSETAYGDISLLAVAPEHRRRGIGSAILSTLIQHNQLPTAKVLNVQHDCQSLKAMLTASGFSLSCRQYEMMLNLSHEE